MGYRKMYKPIVIVLIAFLIFDLILLYFQFEARGANAGIAVAFGFLGNDLYFLHMKKMIKKAKAENSIENLDSVLNHLGGTSWAGVGIAVLLFCGYAGITILMGYVISSFQGI